MGSGIVKRVEGPIVVTRKTIGLKMHEEVKIGDKNLAGEVIRVEGGSAMIQVYEDTEGLKPGLEVLGTGSPLSVELGPGLLSRTFDGIQRPLTAIKKEHGIFIERGARVSALPRDREWDIKILVDEGDELKPNDVVAETEETALIKHKIIVPPGVRGKVVEAKDSGKYNVDEVIVAVEKDNGEKEELKLFHSWPVRQKRPFIERLTYEEILFTGQRVLDILFPLGKGGVAAVPGGFGTGKTVTQHSLAKWADADIVIYIGCGERGNEMAQVLEEFPELEDPRSGKSLMERTILIANTSNMPVTARESSIYTGITIAEYFRDMGYDVALMADSTSRWAEALREISGRMEEMPAEKGYPAYLASRLAEFYERGGRMKISENRVGSVSVVGAVSPPGGDFSEPVTSHTKRFIRTFWVLDRDLAYSRHYPAISWTESYSGYLEEAKDWWQKSGFEISEMRRKVMDVLNDESRLQKIVQLVGEGALPEGQRLILKKAELIKEGFLQQNALSDIDAFCTPEKQYRMLEIIISFGEGAEDLLERGVPLFKIVELPVFSEIKRMKEEIGNEEIEKFDELSDKINNKFSELREEYE